MNSDRDGLDGIAFVLADIARELRHLVITIELAAAMGFVVAALVLW